MNRNNDTILERDRMIFYVLLKNHNKEKVLQSVYADVFCRFDIKFGRNSIIEDDKELYLCIFF